MVMQTELETGRSAPQNTRIRRTIHIPGEKSKGLRRARWLRSDPQLLISLHCRSGIPVMGVSLWVGLVCRRRGGRRCPHDLEVALH